MLARAKRLCVAKARGDVPVQAVRLRVDELPDDEQMLHTLRQIGTGRQRPGPAVAAAQRLVRVAATRDASPRLLGLKRAAEAWRKARRQGRKARRRAPA